MKIAIPTVSNKGLEALVSNVFGRAKIITIFKLKNDSITGIEVVKNPAANFDHGRGPIAIKLLVDKGVNVVAAKEFGIGASALLEQNGIKTFKVKSGIPVKQVIQQVLKKLAEKASQ